MSELAFIDMAEVARVEAYWWVGGPGAKGLQEGDWLAIIYRPLGDPEHLVLKYRWRYYEDDEVFHSNDRRSRWEAKMERGQLAEAIVAVDEMASAILIQFGGKIFRKRFIDGSKSKFSRWLAAQPFAHQTTMTAWNKARPQ